jgi:hypothetical protein
MGQYTEDGGVVSSKLPISERGGGPKSHNSMFGLFRGIVVRAVFPDDEKSYTGDRIEYVVRVRGQEYPNVIDMRRGGGVYNYNERVRQGIEKSYTGELNENQFSENLDGEHVYVMFIEGSGDVPIIVGAATHPKQADYKLPSKIQEEFEVEEFNGLEVMIDKDGTYTITQVGKKDKDGTILNPDATSSIIKMDGLTGDITLDCYGEEELTSARIKLTKKDKKLEFDVDNNSIVLDMNGILVTDKNQNIVEMKAGGVNITVNGKANIKASGEVDVTAGADCKVTASGNAVVTAAKIELNGSSGMVLTTVTDPVIDLITGTPTMGVPTVVAG